jgi:site-specific DNA recombinase
MIRAAIYARISEDRSGEALGVARQVEDCRRLITDRGWTVVREYVDNDFSAYLAKYRPGYEAMLADLGAGELDAIVVYHQDRLTRRPAEFEAFLEACTAAKMTKFTTVAGMTDLNSGDGVLVARITSAVAANESDAKRRRIQRKNDERAANGLPHNSGARAYGYGRDGITVNPDEAAVIRDLAERLLAGESLNSMTRWLQAQGVKTASGVHQWRTQTVRNLLLSPRLAGLRQHRGEVVGLGIWPGIISEDQHRQLVAILNDPNRRTTRSVRRYALSGLLRCGNCGVKMVAAPKKDRRVYGCRKGAVWDGCGKVYVVAEPLDALIADAVLIRLDTKELADQLAGRVDTDVHRSRMRDEIAADEAQLDDLAKAWASKAISMREWTTAGKQVRERKEANQKRLARLSREDSLTLLAGTGSALMGSWSELNLTRQAAIIAQVIDHVIIHPAPRNGARFDRERVEPVWRV